MEVLGKEYIFQKFREKDFGEILAFRGMTKVGYEINKILGPRNSYAKVVISASNSEDFHFSSKVVWQEEDFSEIVLDGILEVLVNKVPIPILNIDIVLQEIEWDRVGSSESAFYTAALMAMTAILKQTDYEVYL